MRVAVLGGGISGCTLAAELAASPRVHVTLIERGQRLGGLHRSVVAGDHVFDIGAFVFEGHHTIFTLFPELRDRFPRTTNRYGSVRAGGALDDYPLTLGGVRRQWGTAFLARVIAEVLLSKIVHRRRDTVESFVAYYIGPTLYRRSGLEAYIERLYHVPAREVDVEFATKRLEAIALSAGLRRNLARIARHLVRGRWPVGLIRPLTADTVHVRPPGGFDEVYEWIAARLRERGVTIRQATTIARIEPLPGRFRLHGLDDPAFEHVFATIPLEVTARLLGMQGYVTPEYRDLYSLFYEYDGALGFPYNVLHNFTARGDWKRLTVLSRYYGTQGGRHFMTVEGTTPPPSDVDQVLTAGARDFEAWMDEVALLPGRLRRVGGVLTRRGYPVYRTRTAREILRLKAAVEARGVRLVGRQGNFDYITSSDAAENAREAARQFLATQAS